MNWLVKFCVLCVLARVSSGQSIKGGSRGVKGSYSQSSQQRAWESTSEVKSQQQNLYNQNPQIPALITARECDRPNAPMNGRLSCSLENDNTYKCTAVCNSGYSFPDQSEKIVLLCNQVNGQWMPDGKFPNCVGGYGGHGSSYQSSYGGGSSGNTYAQSSYRSGGGSQSQSSYGSGGSSQSQSSLSAQGSQSSSGLYSTGGGSQSQRSFSSQGSQSSSGLYSSGSSNQSQRGSLCRQPRTLLNGRHECSMSNGQWSCQGTCNAGYVFPDNSRQKTLTCNDRDGIWSPMDHFENCLLLCHPACENGGICAVNNICNCPPSHRGNRCQFPVALCDFRRLTSKPIGHRCTDLPDYTECQISCPPGTTFSPPSSSVYRCTVNGLWNPPTAPECVRDSLCENPPPPRNGRFQCTGNEETKLCVANCNQGYLFTDGFAELTIQCSRRTGEWTPQPGFSDCEPICTPPCLNEGRCIQHNQCLCTREYRGSRCEYALSNCDSNDRFASVAWHCNNNARETICNISCGATGGTLQPSQPTVYICNLDGTWQPDLKPICVLDHGQLLRGSQETKHYSSSQQQVSSQQHGSSWEHQTHQSQSESFGHFRGQQKMSHEFGGQQQINHEFGGQQQINHEFNQEKIEGGDIDFASNTQRNQNRVNNVEVGQEPVDYVFDDTNFIKAEKFSVVDSHLTRQEQGLEELSVDLPKGGVDSSNNLGYETKAEGQSDIIENPNPADIFARKEKISNYKGICSTWGFYHYRTFDGGIFTHPSSCWYVLASSTDDDFAISVKTECDGHSRCIRAVSIQVLHYSYLLSYDDGLMRNGVVLPIPIQEELTVERIARYLVARSSLGYTVWINDESSVVIVAEDFVQNKTKGMCGNYDGYMDPMFLTRDNTRTPDLFSAANTWRVEDIDGVCMDVAEPTLPCSSETREKQMESEKANLVCAAILGNQFRECREVLDEEIYFAKCQMDCCNRVSVGNCECTSLEEFVRECGRVGVNVNEGWRHRGLCPMTCTNGTEYSECGPPCPPTCSEINPTCQQEKCVDGCHCPPGTVLENGHCISAEQCPCHHGEQVYPPGQTIEVDCNTCVCQDGKWQCTDSICPTTCSMSGPHFTTFDGITYDLYGKCPHYLVEADDFNVQVDYGKNCMQQHPVSSVCVRSITIHTTEGAQVTLKPTMEVSVNGRDMDSLPVIAPGAYVGIATSSFMRAQLSNGLEILWDLRSRIYVYSPADLFGVLKGLCGTFTKSQQDEFLTPEGDIEKSADVFAQKWRVDEGCLDEEEIRSSKIVEKACDVYPRRRQVAAKICNFLKVGDFEECHELLDHERYHANCMEDVCSCQADPVECSCLSFSNYAAACARKGKPISWRKDIPKCGTPCPLGQVYMACTNPCSYSCAEIAHTYSNCRDSCVEGCVCPPGQTLDEFGECVLVSQCSCLHSGHFYPPEFLQRRGREMCECSQGHWSCRDASPSDIILTPPPNIALECDSQAHLENTDCIPECPLTCANYHHHQPCTTAVCVPGCRCMKGFIWDSTTSTCVRPHDCPCHHSGRSYREGEKVRMDCHTCICEGGSWSCDTKPCPGLCSAWGDSHYETFDGGLFDFSGVCNYVMVKAHVSEKVLFSVVVQNVACSIGSDTSCGKSVSITLGDSSVTLTRAHPLPTIRETSRLTVTSAGIFTLVNSDIGISVQWDRNTRVYVTAQPVWQSKLQGLCGDFNGDSSDDFLPPSGGIPLVQAKDFADSWRVHKFCRPASQPEDACELNPDRRTWSREKCGVLKSDLFKSCHYQVEVEEYYKRCVLDACACNAGGDCECLCAVVSAYAQKCARSGIVIPWRSQELCPVQCEACDDYSPCISLCPPPNCDTYLEPPESISCSREPCVDGCEPKHCDPGYVYRSATNFTCVPEETCSEKPCIVIDGVPYREGERITGDAGGDACESCYCRKGKVECVGVMCSAPATTTTVMPAILEECEFTGWTDWVNSMDPKDNNGDDYERIVDLVDLGRIPCPRDAIKGVQCRSALTQQPAESTGQDVTCDQDVGLECKSGLSSGECMDYEMRVFCQCYEEATCPPGKEFNECAYQCGAICQSLLIDLQKDGECDNGPKCVPGCTKQVCQKPYLARDADTCVLPDMCTCKISTGFILAPGQVVTNGCEKCQCLNNTLLCSTTLECQIPKAELPTEKPVFVSLECEDGWTEWVNHQDPDAYGETERLVDHMERGYITCNRTQISDIQCRDVQSQTLIDSAREGSILCDLDIGLQCLNKDMPKGYGCHDYEIRVFCLCAAPTPAPPTIVPYHEVQTTKQPPRIGPTITEGVTFKTTAPPCSYWSKWINKYQPKNRRPGDREDTKPYILSQTEGFCTEGTVTAIECREAATDRDYTETKEEKLICNLEKGFLCKGQHQPDKRCNDYKIRYFCSCEEETTPVMLFLKTTTPAFVYECFTFVPLLNGVNRLPDVNFKASSSASPAKGPDAARIPVIGSGSKAWTAGENNDKQFIEVDLGDVRAIYGVITKGNPVADEWVTSYQLLYSTDGVAYSYYQSEDETNKVFTGNFDNMMEVKHAFSSPFEARLVRLEPLTWEGKISLQLELLGCSEALPETFVTEPGIATGMPVRPQLLEPTPPPKRECTDPMGLESGVLLDSQLSASSSFSSLFTPNFAVLGTESVWAAAVADNQQYLQLDFIDEANVTGVITKGREDIAQWVTAYAIAYSNDGKTWNEITNMDGTLKEFPANYDPYSKVTNEFPVTIRTRYLRILPQNWKNWVSMKIEILGCYHPLPCRDPMGMDSGDITNYQITASSEYSDSQSAVDGRLSSLKSWAPNKFDKNPYLQVDLLKPLKLTGIITKGSTESQQWVKSYFVSYSNDSISWKKVENFKGKAKEFSGNTDQDSAVINLFPFPVVSRFVRLIPVKWHRWTSIRMEVLGCFQEQTCRDPMGLENGVITDGQITASSSYDFESTPDEARYSGKGWKPGTSDPHPYLQVDFLDSRNVSAVVTKGLSLYKILHSADEVKWYPVIDDLGDVLEFPGNDDLTIPRVHTFPEVEEGRYFRIVPLDKDVQLNLEFLGCYHPHVCQEPLGMESGAIYDFQLSASSYSNPTFAVTNARLDSDTAWVADKEDSNPYIEVDLLVPTNVTGVMTRGRNDANEWVTAYEVGHSDDGGDFLNIADENRKAINFKANYDSDSPVTNIFTTPIFARYIRLKPTQYEKRASMRFEIIGCFEEKVCMEPMGLETGLLSDSQITSSSYLNQFTKPFDVRLSSKSAWSPDSVDVPQYVQVDFGGPRNITAIVTRGSGTSPEWVTAYQIGYSSDYESWSTVKDRNGKTIAFPGNKDQDTQVINVLPETIEVQYVRIIPMDWENWISIRAEILGCYHPYEIPTGFEMVLPEFPVLPDEVLDQLGYPTPPTLVAPCPNPMEAESSVLKDAIIRASSSTPTGTPSRIKLNTKGVKGLSGGWVPKVEDLHPFLFIELPETKWLTSIYIQGRDDGENWVKTLRVLSSEDNSTWLPVFGPNGDEIIEGNSDQNNVVGHYFKSPMETKYIKIIPETWHKWPSFRLDLRGCQSPEVSTTVAYPTPAEFPAFCPELALEPELGLHCPSSCPDGFLCDGYECVDPVDCSCVHDGRIFKVSDKLEDHECLQCDCALGGHSRCTKKVCPSCDEDKRPVLDEDCECSCEKCDEGEIMCISNHQCIPLDRWCDDTVDCPDDETNCPEKTTLYQTTTTTPFIIPTTPAPPVNATCEIMGKHIKTFDGQDITYDICHHIVMKDKAHEFFNVSVHKDCGYIEECKHSVEVGHRKHYIKIYSNLTVLFDGHIYTPSQLAKLSEKLKKLTVKKIGDQVVVKSPRGFSVVYDNKARLKIEVPPNLLKKINGLCGYYSGTPEDDQMKPDGKKAFTSREFGDSWSIGEENDCAPIICPHEVMVKALEQCNKLREEPFTECNKVVTVTQFIEFCMSSTCECMLKNKDSDEKCKCDSLETFAEVCEEKLGPMSVRNWRLKHECVSECPPGTEWNDCGPSCQLTCDRISDTSLDECNAKCVPGCFCPPGKVLNDDKCISPDECDDQVCLGFGDPHFKTFDGLFFPFHAEGTFLIVADKDNVFVVNGFSRQCSIFTHNTCVSGLEVLYKEHKVTVRKSKELEVDGVKVPMDDLPKIENGFVILGYPGRTFVVSIPHLSLEARYYEENSGFAVKLSSRRYFNQTEGLCGNCNGKKDDELKDKPLEKFVCSWQIEGDNEECEASFKDMPPLAERIPLCDKLEDPVFQACHPLVDPELYIEACNFDAAHSGKVKLSFCKTAMEYGRECCQSGISIEDWPEKLECDIDCPKGLHYEQCHRGCPQTCFTLKNTTFDPSCSQLKLDGCFCPGNKVLNKGICVDPVHCETCDEEGHVPGDTWNDGNCKKCTCRSDLTTECVLEKCPSKPVCSTDESLAEVREENEESSCCKSYTCVPKEKDCPPVEVPSCPKGEVAKVHTSRHQCPEFECECDPALCSPVVWPDELEDGQVAEMVNESCCPRIRVACHPLSCGESLKCEEGLDLVEVEGKCCTIYKCKPPEDVCVYSHLYKIIDGFQTLVDPVESITSVFKPGEEWQDGNCQKCTCVQSKGQHVPSCVAEQCISLEHMAENEDYVLIEKPIPEKCCPEIYRTQCKDLEGNTYEEGEQWTDEIDPCVTYVCELSAVNGVRKTKNVRNCTECPKTAMYFPPSKSLHLCCGMCQTIRCEDNDKLHEIGDKWVNPDQPCREAECIREYGIVKTVYTKQPCPTIPTDCPKESITWDEKGCCQVCNVTSEIHCTKLPIPESDTIGFFTFHDASHRGICTNDRPVTNVLQCSGACHSQSYYSLEDGDFREMCQCCKVNTTTHRTIDLKCPDFSYIKKTFLQPETCQCSKCAPKTAKIREKETGRWAQTKTEDDNNWQSLQTSETGWSQSKIEEDNKWQTLQTHETGQLPYDTQQQWENDEFDSLAPMRLGQNVVQQEQDSYK